MSRNLTVRFDGTGVVLPLKDVDRILATHNDNPTFGNVREIYARNCYLSGLNLKEPMRTVLDLGANRGMFSVLALTALGTKIAVGVEPMTVYDPVLQLLLTANRLAPEQAPRYAKFITSPSVEQQDPERNVSIQTILREQNIDRFNFVKIDIEGCEKGLFSEPEWLAHVDTLSMELHPQFVGDLSVVPQALDRYNFHYRILNQQGKPVGINDAMFLQASCTGTLPH